MENQDIEKEIIGSLAGYAITVGLFLAMIYVLGIIEGERFYSLLVGFFGGVGLGRWLWSREKSKWLAEKDNLEGRLAALASEASEARDPDLRPDSPISR